MLLDAPWGSGKTTFVRMWIGELQKKRMPAIYFDAFSNDYQEDAFIAISSHIIGELDRLKTDAAPLARFKSAAVNVAKIIGASALRIGLKAATAGAVEMGEFGKTATEIASAFGDEAEKGLEQVLRRRLESHDADKLAFSSFHHSLSELASGLSCQASEASGADRSKGIIVPLVFIIDELDRCKPSFALEVLEKIKHFFSVPGVSFMIVCSVEHLVASVRYAYGNIDALMYLEKFYHIRILFPSANRTTRDMVATTYLRHLECGGTAADIIDQYSRYNPLSLHGFSFPDL